MELKNKYNEVFYAVKYLEDKNIVYSNWTADFLSVDDVKKGALLGLKFIKDNNAFGLINDNRELEGAWDEANDWIAEVWMPQAIEAGLKKFAHILSENLFAQLSAEFMGDNNSRKEDEFALKMFDNYEDAEKWVLE